eukprot:s12352_g1.t1
MASDSSTALCKMNRRGAFTKSDLDQEVRWAALTLGWSEVRYTMCWGKTMAWIQWQIDEHVKEIRANYPDHIIDIIAWWCGNEISGQRSADVLAVLADAPDIGFVKIIGQVEASLFQLHSAYDLFNDAMFAEFRSRGLQTQSATSLVEKLELYDSFHASESENNRQVFQSYIHNTLNLSKSEWLAQKLAPAVRALLPRYPYQERGEAHNPIVEETFANWREEKELILNPKVTLKPKHRVVTPEDRLWEAPNVAKAENLTKVILTPPEDKAIRKDVPWTADPVGDERGEAHNPIVEETFAKWREEKELILNPKEKELILNPKVTLKPKHRVVTPEDRLWEAPDVAKAENLTKVILTPPEDKAIRKDVPSYGKSTDVSAIDECLHDVVAQDDNGQITYEAPGSVALVDDGEYEPPIPASIGRVIQPKKDVKPSRKTDRDEDALRRQMYVDQSASQEAASAIPRLPNEYFYNGVVHRMMPLNPEDIVGDKNVKFNHGDLKFLSMLLRPVSMALPASCKEA